MSCEQNKHWWLYTSQGYLCMNGKLTSRSVLETLLDNNIELYDIKYMGYDNYITYLKVKFDKILKMPSAVK